MVKYQYIVEYLSNYDEIRDPLPRTTKKRSRPIQRHRRHRINNHENTPYLSKIYLYRIYQQTLPTRKTAPSSKRTLYCSAANHDQRSFISTRYISHCLQTPIPLLPRISYRIRTTWLRLLKLQYHLHGRPL